jgi:hypothetical protein
LFLAILVFVAHFHCAFEHPPQHCAEGHLPVGIGSGSVSIAIVSVEPLTQRPSQFGIAGPHFGCICSGATLVSSVAPPQDNAAEQFFTAPFEISLNESSDLFTNTSSADLLGVASRLGAPLRALDRRIARQSLQI